MVGKYLRKVEHVKRALFQAGRQIPAPRSAHALRFYAVCTSNNRCDPHLLNKYQTQDFEGANAAFEKSVQLHPTSDGFYNLANTLFSLGKSSDAIKAWTRCIDIEPDQIDAHVNLANVYALSLRDPVKAIEHYKIAASINPADGEVQYNYAVVLDSLGRLEEAIELYDSAAKNGIDEAEKHSRNAKARLLGKRLAQQNTAKP
ncbi:TPR-like protein [Chytriomyces cf. hyalinus JEL632]|nr:TPR-like protein [Chytriomyces cf. hyalinus JEL632]